MKLFLDSGAHSFYMKSKLKKEELTDDERNLYLSNYIKYIREHKKQLEIYVNLDVINDPVLSYTNWITMKEADLEPIAVVHPGESVEWVERYLSEGCTYIGLGGLGQFFTKEKYIVWVRGAWEILRKRSDVKVHGFAMTSVDLLTRFPWYSVDSTSWVLFARYGAIIMPKTSQGEKDYTQSPIVIFMSDRSPKKAIEGQHFDTLSKMEQKKVTSYAKERGFTIDELSSDHFKRDQLNFLFYIDLEKTVTANIYFAGNFPVMKDLKKERLMRNKSLKEGSEYKRLISFYFKKYSDNLLKLKNNLKRQKIRRSE